jgi:hypothetical protein
MFDDIIKKQHDHSWYQNEHRLKQINAKCPTCIHSEPTDNYAKFRCKIQAGLTCAWSKENPFNEYVPILSI